MRTELRFQALILAGTVMIASIGGCGKNAGEGSGKTQSGGINALENKPLAEFQRELLEVAFETASSIPVNPHIKDRSRAQEAVVAACLELDQPARALGYTERIDDWRRGMCYADLAFYCAETGEKRQARQYIELAGKVAETAEDWRRDRIRVRIAQSYTLLGQDGKADELEAGVADSEAGKVAGVEAARAGEGSFDEQMKALEALLAPDNLDLRKNALEAFARLFDRFYDDPAQRSMTEEKIKGSWDLLPILLRIDLLMDLGESALNHADREKAIALADEAGQLLEAHQWPAEHRAPLIARMAKLRFRAGDAEKARADADATLSLYEAERASIINIDRAGALRPLAEAYHAMGDTSGALAVYKKAIEEGVENPNSRPRAEDLSATCRSLALNTVEPDAELWSRIRQIQQGLGNPW